MLLFTVVCYVVAVAATLLGALGAANGAAMVGTLVFACFALTTVARYAAALWRDA